MKSVTDPTIPPVVLGSVGLSTTSSQWTCPATIPFNTAYGNYTLSAELSGKVLATTEITVEEIPLFILELIDPTTHLVVGVDQVYPGGSACTVRGERFPNGNINLIITGMEPPVVAAAVAVGNTFEHTFNVPGDPSANSVTITVTATPAGSSIGPSISFRTLGAPK